MNRTFTVAGNIESVDDIMIGIPRCFRDEFIDANFDSYDELSLCLAHADVARKAGCTRGEGWRHDTELQAMRQYLK